MAAPVVACFRELEATTEVAAQNLDENIHDDLSSLDLGIHEARDLAHNRPFWELMSAQRYALIVVHATIGRCI